MTCKLPFTLISHAMDQSSKFASTIVAGCGRYAALRTRTSHEVTCLETASFIAFLSAMFAAATLTATFGNSFLTAPAVSDRRLSRLPPKRKMEAAPAAAKAFAVSRPIPDPAPVKTTCLPRRDSSGLEGLMAGYVALYAFFVKQGIPASRR